MNNLLAASEIASVFMDARLNIERYTPAAARIIKLIPSDIGRPLSDLAKPAFRRSILPELAKKVLQDLNSLGVGNFVGERSVYGMSMKVMPYRTGAECHCRCRDHRDGYPQGQAGRQNPAIWPQFWRTASDAITVQDFKEAYSGLEQRGREHVRLERI
jgi:hypothetical protein